MMHLVGRQETIENYGNLANLVSTTPLVERQERNNNYYRNLTNLVSTTPSSFNFGDITSLLEKKIKPTEGSTLPPPLIATLVTKGINPDFFRGMLETNKMVKENSCLPLVVKTDIESPTGRFLYSDMYYEAGKLKIEKRGHEEIITIEKKGQAHYTSLLNRLVAMPFIGLAAAVARVGLSIIHIFGHLFAALITQKRGHLFHALKGVCELSRSLLECVPLAGRIFTQVQSFVPDPIKYTLDGKGVYLYEKNMESIWLMKIINTKKQELVELPSV